MLPRQLLTCTVLLPIWFSAFPGVARAQPEADDKAALEKRKQQGMLLWSKAAECERLGEYGPAVDYYREVERLFPQAPLVKYRLGICYRKLGRTEEGVDAYTTFLSAAANNLELKDEVEDARKALEDLLLSPLSAKQREQLSIAIDQVEVAKLWRLNNPLKTVAESPHLDALRDAIRTLEVTLSIIPAHPPTWRALGREWEELGESSRAYFAYDRYLKCYDRINVQLADYADIRRQRLALEAEVRKGVFTGALKIPPLRTFVPARAKDPVTAKIRPETEYSRSGANEVRQAFGVPASDLAWLALSAIPSFDYHDTVEPSRCGRYTIEHSNKSRVIAMHAGNFPENSLLLRDAKSRKELHTLTGWYWAFSHDGKLLATADLLAFRNDGRKHESVIPKVRVYDLSTGKQLWEQPLDDGNSVLYGGPVQFSQDDRQVITRYYVREVGNRIRYRDVSDSTKSRKVDAANVISAVSADGRYLVTVEPKDSRDLHILLLIDTEDGRRIRTFHGHTRWVNLVRLSPDGKYMLSWSDFDEVMRLWDVSTGRELAHLDGHEGKVCQLVFSADGQYAACRREDNVVIIWALPDPSLTAARK